MCIVERNVLDDLGLGERKLEPVDYQIPYDHDRRWVQGIPNEKNERGEGEPDGSVRAAPPDLIKRNVAGTKYRPLPQRSRVSGP